MQEKTGLERMSTASLIAAGVLVAVTIIVLYRVLGLLMEEADLRDEEAELELEHPRPHLLADEVAEFLGWKASKADAEGAGEPAATGGEG